MATLSTQTSNFAGLNYTLGSASVADKVANDGRTVLIFSNGNASSRTLTFAANDVTPAGFGVVATPDTVVTLPGSGTNGGRCIVGPFPPDRFNDADGFLNYTLSDATGMSVAAVKMAR